MSQTRLINVPNSCEEKPCSSITMGPAVLSSDTPEPIVARKKKCRKYDDGTYRPGDERRRKSRKNQDKSQFNLLKARTDCRTEMSDTEDENQKKKIVTSVIYYPEAFKIDHSVLPTVAEVVQKELEKVETYAAPTEILEKNEKGSPIKIKADGQVLSRVTSFGAINPFANFNVLEPLPVTSIPATASFFQSDEYKAVLASNESVKISTVTITTKSMQLARKSRKKGKGRLKSQKAVLAAPGYSGESATNYVANAAKEVALPDQEHEYGHDVPHAAIGDQAQNPKHLSTTTKPGNTGQMFLDNHLSEMCKASPNGVQYYAETHVIPSTSIGIERQVKVDAGLYTFPATFNLQRRTKCHISESGFFSAMAKGLISGSNQLRQTDLTVQSNVPKDPGDTNSREQSSVDVPSLNKFKFFFSKQEEQTKPSTSNTPVLK